MLYTTTTGAAVTTTTTTTTTTIAATTSTAAALKIFNLVPFYFLILNLMTSIAKNLSS
jgi:hypothetical protein